MTSAPATGPFDSRAGSEFLSELSRDFSVGELEAMLQVGAGQDLELGQEQYALAAVLVGAPTSLVAVVDALRSQDVDRQLLPAARDSMNRLLNDPYALLWQGHQDGGIAIKREVRALRARLHRACSQ